MKRVTTVASSLLFAGASALSSVALADTTKANCEFYSHGDKKSDRSGPCTFSQRQGYIDINLANGKSFDLKPGEKANHYKDQDGHKVRRKEAANGATFQWEHKRVVVSFNGAQGSSAAATGSVAVKDMARYCAGEASAKFNQRPNNISTQPAFSDQGMYSVYGQYPPSGADPTVFICTFSDNRQFVAVDKQ